MQSEGHEKKIHEEQQQNMQQRKRQRGVSTGISIFVYWLHDPHLASALPLTAKSGIWSNPFFFFLQDFMPVGNSLLNAPLRLGGHRSSAQCQHYAASTWVTVDVWLSWDLTVILNVSNRSVQYVGWLHFAVSVCLGNGWHAVGTEWVCWRLVLTQPRSTSLLYK